MKPTPSEAKKMTSGAGMQLDLRGRSGISARDGRLKPVGYLRKTLAGSGHWH